MSLRTRIENVERRAGTNCHQVPRPPFFLDDEGVGGMEIDGEFVTWEEWERRYPDAGIPCVQWSGLQREPGGPIEYGRTVYAEAEFRRRFPERDWTVLVGEERRATFASKHYNTEPCQQTHPASSSASPSGSPKP